MATVFDVAEYLLALLRAKNKAPVTTWKLQKLVYYSQAWSLVWDEEPLFPATIQAWADGPVCPDLYDLHKGKYKISMMEEGNPDNLNETQKETAEVVFKHYGKMSGQALSELTHRERPWKDARKGLRAGSPSKRIITHEAMAEYYASLL